MKHIAIIGSRNFPEPGPVAAFVTCLPADTVVVSGGAPGVDSFAEEAAKANGLETLIFPADWDGLGRQAGPIRNAQIVAQADRVVVFWDGASRGTLNTVLLATRAGLPVEVYDGEGVSIALDRVLRVAEERSVLVAIEAAEARAPQ